MSLAERKGFEPSIRFHVYTLSRRAPSTTRTPLCILKDCKNSFSALATEYFLCIRGCNGGHFFCRGTRNLCQFFNNVL